MTTRQALLTVAVAALLATAMAWDSSALWYLDNPCHLLDLQQLGTRVLPEQGWFHGWSTMANAGADVGGVNAPLPWFGLALLVAAGLPAGLVYRLAMVGAVLVHALGAFAVGRRLGLGLPAATMAGVLVAVLPVDLVGIAGGLAGMWPYRLANGLLYLGLARWRPERVPVGTTALWLAAVLLCHAYTGVVAAGIMALLGASLARQRSWLSLSRLAGAGAIALLLACPYWLPQLTGGRAAVVEVTRLDPLGSLSLLMLPIRPHDLLTGQPWTTLGHHLSWLPTVALVLGWHLAIQRFRKERPTVDPLAGWLGLGLLVLLVLVLLGGLGILGPNPWRHIAHGRAALAIVAAAGLAPLLTASWARRAAVAALALVGLQAGLNELPNPVTHAEVRQAIPALRATWGDLAASQHHGRIYHQETFLDPTWSGPLAWSHTGAMLGVERDLPVLGSWYGVSPVPTVPHTMDQGVALMGAYQDVVLADPDWLHARFRRFGVGGVVTVEPALAAALAAQPERYSQVSDQPPFAAFVLTQGPLPLVGLAAPTARAALSVAEPTEVIATISADGPVDFVLRQAWDPGWSASLDGAPLAVSAGPDDGLITGTLPGPGTLELRWRPRSKPLAPIGLLGLLLALGAAVWERRRA
jgi:hypothetical protein